MTGTPFPTDGATRAAAFFDLDKTIIATSSAYAFGREFMHNGLITHAEALQLSLAKASYMLAGHSSEHMDTTRDQLAAMAAGWSVQEVHDIAVDTMHSVVTPAIYAEARALIDAHRAAGHEVVIISASASVLVEPIAQELGIEHVVATELAEEDGRFTGEILFYCKGAAKAEALARMAKQLNVDPDVSFAYSDSATDIPMLEQYIELVGPKLITDGLAVFEKMMPGYLSILESNLTARDTKGVVEEGHKIKGAAGSVGLRHLQQLGQQIQSPDLPAWEDNVGEWVEEMKQEWQHDVAVLKAWVANAEKK